MRKTSVGALILALSFIVCLPTTALGDHEVYVRISGIDGGDVIAPSSTRDVHAWCEDEDEVPVQPCELYVSISSETDTGGHDDSGHSGTRPKSTGNLANNLNGNGVAQGEIDFTITTDKLGLQECVQVSGIGALRVPAWATVSAPAGPVSASCIGTPDTQIFTT